MKTKKVILVSGMSGAGKSSVMSILEDLGYLCMDNLPLGIIDDLIDWLAINKDKRYEYIAITTSALEFRDVQRKLRLQDFDLRSIFLDAQDSVLVHRYQFTRRKHPYIINKSCATLAEAIKLERQQFEQTTKDILLIDTSNLSYSELRSLIEKERTQDGSNAFSISLVSFGYRYGLPLDADLIFDCRMLKNPFWDEELKEMSGNDKPVRDFVLNDDLTIKMIEKIVPYLDFVIKSFQNSQKTHITIAFGCTGGKHRSVSVVNYFCDYLSMNYKVLKLDRDYKREIE